MKISIICAAFRAELLDRVWESIKGQTYNKFEVIFVNDAQQGVRDWYKKRKDEGCFNGYDVWLIDLEKQKGRFGLYTRNIGAFAASHDNILFLDDDNEWEPDHIESLVNLKEKTGKHPFCWIHIKGKKEDSEVDRIKPTSFVRQHIDLGCLLWERKWFERYGGFRDDSQVSFDWNAMARVCFNEGPHNFVCTEKPTLIFWHKRY